MQMYPEIKVYQGVTNLRLRATAMVASCVLLCVSLGTLKTCWKEFRERGSKNPLAIFRHGKLFYF